MTKIDGSVYVPLPRNNAILRTPEDPEATLRYMIGAWEAAAGDRGSDGWWRIITQAGPDLTWESFMADSAKPYAALFPEHVRRRVADALDRDASTTEWRRRQADRQQTESAHAERIASLRAQYRSGQRQRPAMPELDNSLRGQIRPTR